METFVFTLRLQQLRCSALVLRLQTHNPRKRTVAEGVLSLRQLGHQEAEHWLDFNPPSKSSVMVGWMDVADSQCDSASVNNLCSCCYSLCGNAQTFYDLPSVISFVACSFIMPSYVQSK